MLERSDYEVYDEERGVWRILPGNPAHCPQTLRREPHPNHLFEYECLHHGTHVKGNYMCTRQNRGF
jgi:hypothetical protein